MKNRKIVLHDGTSTRINDSDWTDALANRKIFDSQNTEIVRVTGNPQRGLVRIYAMRSVAGKIESEFNGIVLRESDLAACVKKAGADCGLSEQIVAAAISDLP